jgi:hypothetical protein
MSEVVDSHCHLNTQLAQPSVIDYQSCIIYKNIDWIEFFFYTINELFDWFLLREVELEAFYWCIWVRQRVLYILQSLNIFLLVPASKDNIMSIWI